MKRMARGMLVMMLLCMWATPLVHGPRVEARPVNHDQHCPEGSMTYQRNVIARREARMLRNHGIFSNITAPDESNWGCFKHAGNTKVMVISMREGSPPKDEDDKWSIEFSYKWSTDTTPTGWHGWIAFYRTNTILPDACAPNCPGDGAGTCCLINRTKYYTADLVPIAFNTTHSFQMSQDAQDTRGVNLKLDGVQLTKLPLPLTKGRSDWKWATLAQYEHHYAPVGMPPHGIFDSYFYNKAGGQQMQKGGGIDGSCDSPFGSKKLSPWRWEGVGPLGSQKCEF